MEIRQLEEFALGEQERQAIQQLLGDCFPDYPADRIYYKQLPDFRLLAWENDRLVGHLPVEHRMIDVGGMAARIFGIADFCVAGDFQHRGLGTQLLNRLEQLGKEHAVDFLLLLASRHEVYLHNGFQLVQNPCRWLIIHDHRSLGVSHRRLPETLLVKALGSKPWREGVVDLLGHIF